MAAMQMVRRGKIGGSGRVCGLDGSRVKTDHF